MNLLLKEIRHNPLLWLLAFVPVVIASQQVKPEAHTLLIRAVRPGHRAPGGVAESCH